jgi:hypothetical protein
MPRKTFDLILSSVGLMLTIVLFVAGGLAYWGYSFATAEVKNQLAAQHITFPEAGSEGLTGLPAADQAVIVKYAGQQLTTGQQARAFADNYIAAHLQGVADGKTYSEVSALSRANPDDAELAAQVQTLFRGETLRGLLLESYGFWKLGQLALIGAIVAFVLGGIMLILTIIGFVHLRRVSPSETVLMPETKSEPVPAQA